jgi:AraC family transcriptional regulator of arabinose operon
MGDRREGFVTLTHDDVLLPVRYASAPTYWPCEPDWSWRAYPLPDHVLWCVLDGTGELVLDGQAAKLAPGTCAVFAPGDEPIATHDRRRRLLVFGLHFTLHDDGTAATALDPLRYSCPVRDLALLRTLAGRCDVSYRRGDHVGLRQSRLCFEQVLLLMLEAVTGARRPGVDESLAEISQQIRRDPSRHWSVGELAATAALSRAQFTRRFTAHAGLPPAHYVIRTRIDRARQLLTEAAMSVSEVASVLGYPDAGSFSRQYRKVTGETPSVTRKAALIGPDSDA